MGNAETAGREPSAPRTGGSVSESTPAAQIEALRDLVQSKGWSLFTEAVLQEIASEFEQHITSALSVADSTMALDKARQVAAVRLAGLRWLKLPQERLRSLSEQVHRSDEIEQTRIGRRPVGL